jgi:Spy/CpxP family protein refolding chaperone
MYPGMIPWWRRAREMHFAREGCGPSAGFGSHGFGSHSHSGPSDDEGSSYGGGTFGVRRPLRFLAYRLELREEQVAELAKVLAELKTERAQASVDNRRTLSGLADSVGGDTFDAAKAAEAGKARSESADRLARAVSDALEKIHALLDAEQRKQFAYLIRTGAIAI